jgi:hypothetical protein
MAGSSGSLHESESVLKPETIDRHRAVVSIMEELEAIDWYDQRIDAARDQELKDLLAHNRDEEKEHASMMLEWLRRHDAKLDEHLRTYRTSRCWRSKRKPRARRAVSSPRATAALASGACGHERPAARASSDLSRGVERNRSGSDPHAQDAARGAPGRHSGSGPAKRPGEIDQAARREQRLERAGRFRFDFAPRLC